MPVKSAKQFRLMEGIKHGMKFKGKGVGPSKEVADEMIGKTSSNKKSLFAKGKK